MGSVDNRVVSVKFDNNDFMNKVGPTLQNLDKLKGGLDLDKQARNLDGLTQAGKRFNLDNMSQTIEAINNKFSLLGVTAFSVVNTIVERFTLGASQLAKAFTLDPLISGFSEFETNANSIQTILANTADAGVGLDRVTGALDNLNEYADKTIYNFSQMARNIGTFTAAGVSLDDSTNAIKGIANLAAMAGSSAEQASSVMYQLSQAMSAGKVSAVDWISVTNAGIGGPLKKQLFEAAKALKTLTDVPVNMTFDQWVASGGDFKKAMEDGVFTSETLKLALGAMSGDMSRQQLIAKGYSEQQADWVLKTATIGTKAATEVKTFTQLISTLKEAVGTGWAESFKKIIGNFEEAKSLFTGLSDIFGGIINKQSEYRNGLLEGWKFFGGREALIQSLRDVLWSLFSVIHSVTSAFREVFPAMQPERLANLTKSFERLVAKLIPTGETLEKIHRIFVGLFSVIHAAWTVIKTVGSAIKDFALSLDFLKALPGGILEVFAKIGDGAKTLTSVIGDGSAIKTFLDKYLRQVADFLNQLAANIEPYIQKVKDAFDKIRTFFADLFTKDAAAGYESFSQTVSDATGRIRQRWEQLAGAGEKLKEFWDKFLGYLNQAKDYLKNIWDSITDSFKQGNFDSVLDKVNVGLLGGLLYYLRKFVKDGLTINIKGVSDLFETLGQSLDILQNKVKADMIKSIAIAVAVLTASVLVLSLIDSAALTKALVAMATFFGELVGTLKALDEMLSGVHGAAKMASISFGLGLMSVAVIGFVVAIKKMSDMDTTKMLQGIGGLGLVLAMLLIFIDGLTKLMKKIKKQGLDSSNLVDLGIGLIGIGIAVKFMASSVESLGKLSMDQMLQGLGGLLAILAGISLLVKATDGEHYIAMGIGLLFVTFAIKLLVGVVRSLGEMNYDQLVQGLEAFLVIMAGLALTLDAFPDDTAKIGLGLFFISRALSKMVDVVKQFGEMDFGTLAKGLGAVGVTLLILAAALKAMEGKLEGGLALFVAVGALIILAEVIEKIGNLGLGNVLVAMFAIVGSIAALSFAALLLADSGVILALEALALALVGIGLAVALVGGGIYLIAQSFHVMIDAAKKLQETGIGAVRAFLEFLPEIAAAGARAFGAFIASFFEQIPVIFEKLGPAVDSVVNFIVEKSPKFGEAFTAIFQTILTVLEENVPRLIEVGFKLLVAFLTGIRDNIGNITTLVNDIIYQFLVSMGERVQTLINAGMYLLSMFLQGIADNIWMVYEAAGNLISALIEGMDRVVQKIIEAGGNLIIHIIEGIGKKSRDISDAGTDTLIKFLANLAEDAVRFADAGLKIVTNLLNGLAWAIDNNRDQLRDAGANLARAIIDGLTGGIATKAGEAWEAFKNVAKGALGAFAKFLGIESPSKEMYKMGIWSLQGLTNAVNQDTTVTDAFGNLGNNALGSLNKALSSGSAISDLISESNPTITPVLDLTNVDKGLSQIGKKTPIIDTYLSRDQATSLAKATKLLSAQDVPAIPQPVNTTKEFNFNQTIHSPKALNIGELYRQTKSQFATAKEGLESVTNEGN